ncbi:MAG: helix-turn-helix domain-containing protein [Paracoccaceae bacterium]
MHITTLDKTHLSRMSIDLSAATLRDFGFDPASAYADAQVPLRAKGHIGRNVTARQDYLFQRHIAHLTRDTPEVWLEIGARSHLPTMGYTGLALLTAPTLNEFMVRSRSWQPLFHTFGRGRRVRGPMGETIGFEFDVSGAPDDHRAFTLFRGLASGLTSLSDMGHDITKVVRAIELEAAYARYASLFCRYGVPVRLHPDRSRIYWVDDLINRPVALSNTVSHSYYADQCDMQIEAISRITTDTFLDQLEAAVSAMLENPSLSRVASSIGVSERTLQRRLEERNLSYQEIINTIRTEMAKKLLQSTTMSIGEISMKLGYADTAGFSCAFKRWTGESPRSFRKALFG